jgi:hypothetical protein
MYLLRLKIKIDILCPFFIKRYLYKNMYQIPLSRVKLLNFQKEHSVLKI